MISTLNQDYLRKWLSETGNFPYPVETKCIGNFKDGWLVAVVGFNNFTQNSCQIHVASKGDYWMNKSLLLAAFDYPFNKLKVKVILAAVASTNEEALKLDRHLGFVDKAYIEDAHADGDLVILAMRRENCRWLDIKTPLI